MARKRNLFRIVLLNEQLHPLKKRALKVELNSSGRSITDLKIYKENVIPQESCSKTMQGKLCPLNHSTVIGLATRNPMMRL